MQLNNYFNLQLNLELFIKNIFINNYRYMENVRITTNPLYQSQNTVNNNISNGYDKLNNIPKSLNNNIYNRLKPFSLETYVSTLS